MIVYIHGFRSSPLSFKAQLLAQALQQRGRIAEWWSPALPPSPAAALALLRSQLQSYQQANLPITLIGSSLGGFYATVLAEQLGLRAVLLNPACDPATSLASQVGVHAAFHDPSVNFEFKAEFLDELNSAYPTTLTNQAQRYFLLAATGDEVLDYREMLARYSEATKRVINGSDHGISEFADYLAEVLAWCDAALE
jgi:uncharacterized protein